MPTPTLPDAIGYINDLARETGLPWFDEVARMIDEVVNEVVFANRRHQYKDKGNQAVSVFPLFTRVVPLAMAWARQRFSWSSSDTPSSTWFSLLTRM